LFVFVILFTTWFVLRQRRFEEEALSLLNKPFVEYKEVVRLLGPPTVIGHAGIAHPGTTLGPKYLDVRAQESLIGPSWFVTLRNRDVVVDITLDAQGNQLSYHCDIDDEEISPWHRLRIWLDNLDWPW
jgi:hypothetical protein